MKKNGYPVWLQGRDSKDVMPFFGGFGLIVVGLWVYVGFCGTLHGTLAPRFPSIPGESISGEFAGFPFVLFFMVVVFTLLTSGIVVFLQALRRYFYPSVNALTSVLVPLAVLLAGFCALWCHDVPGFICRFGPHPPAGADIGYACWVVPTALFGFLLLARRNAETADLWCHRLIWLAVAFPLVAFVVGLAGQLVLLATDTREAAAWPTVAGQIEDAFLSEPPGPGMRVYVSRGQYRYVWGGRAYVSDRFWLHEGMTFSTGWQRAGNAAIEKSRANDDQIRVSVNPADPAESVLFPELRFELFPLVILLVCVVGFFGFRIVFYWLPVLPDRFLGRFVPARPPSPVSGGAPDSVHAFAEFRPAVQQRRIADLLATLAPAAFACVLFLIVRGLPDAAFPTGQPWTVFLLPLIPVPFVAAALFGLFRYGRFESVRRDGTTLLITGLPPDVRPVLSRPAVELPSSVKGCRAFSVADTSPVDVTLPANGHRPALVWKAV